MKPKIVSLGLIFAVLITASSSVNAKQLADRTKINSPPAILAIKVARPKPIRQWRFLNANQDLGVPHTKRAEGDWDKIAVISKPYRDNGSGLKPFPQWAFENITRDLGYSYTPQQKSDWNLLAILTKPYR